jgi:hypothetical protein
MRRDDRIGTIQCGSDTKVHVLEGPQGGNPDVVNLLLLMLQRARRGDLAAVALVTVASTGTVATCWESGDGHFHELASGALALCSRLGGD